MNGKIIKEVHSCRLLAPNPYKYARGTIWECDCGNQFELLPTKGRIPELVWLQFLIIKGENE